MKLLKRAPFICVSLLGFVGFLCLSSSGQSNGTQVLYFPHLADGGGYTTAWHLTGLSAGISVVTIELFDQDGYPLTVATDNGTSSIFRFTLGRSASGSLQTLGTTTSVKVGWAKITATQTIGASEHFKLTSPNGSIISEADVPASAPIGAATLIVPDSLNTAIAFLNINPTANTFSFNLVDANGNLLAVGSRTLASYSQMALYQFQIPGLENAFTLNGSLEVSASAPFSVVTVTYDGLTFSTAPVLPPRAGAGNRAALLNLMTLLREQLDAATNQFLSPSAGDLAPYATFLEQPHTGIIVLTPRGKYDDIIPMNGGGSYYSFFLLTHEYGYGSDIGLEQNNFLVGFAGIDFGFITALGDVPIDGVGTDTPGVQYLASYAPPSTVAGARVEQQRSGDGFSVGSYFYRGRLTAQANTTYALRSVSYGSSDLLVAFRVLRFDTDGSAILVWKQLASFVVPLWYLTPSD
jgi:hypothetical protein